MTSNQPTTTVEPTVKKIVKLGEESFLIIQIPPEYGEDDKVGPVTIQIEPSTGGGICCDSLHNN